MNEAAFELIENVALNVSTLLDRELKRTEDLARGKYIFDRINKLGFLLDKARHEQKVGAP